MKLLILDNYDSFTYNLVHLIEKVSDIVFDVVQNDKITLAEINAYDKIVLSPGPGLPKNAGIMPQLIQNFRETKNILGVCLGMQAIGEAYGATLCNLKTVAHGVSKPIHILKPDALFKNCPTTFNVGRYHSWVVASEKLHPALQITAVDNDGNIMALRHLKHQVCGVQFHPESILSDYGEIVIGNWLNA